MDIKMLTQVLALSIFAVFSAGAQQPNERQSELYRGSVAQDSLRKDAAAIQAQVNLLRGSGGVLSAADLQQIDQAVKVLDDLTRNEMARATELLRSASQSPDEALQLQKIQEAYKVQNAIRTKLKRISAELSARQALAALAPGLANLFQRQVSATNEMGRLFLLLPGPVKAIPDALKKRYDSVSTDQDALSEELGLALAKLKELSESLPEESRQPLVAAAVIARERKVGEFSDAAAKSLKGAPFGVVLDCQKPVQTALCKMLFALQPAVPQERLKHFVDDLGEMITAQTGLGGEIKAVPEKRPLPIPLYRVQRDLADRTALLIEQIREFSVQAVGGLAQAQEVMEKSLIALNKNDKPALPELQESAAARLTAVKELLEKQLAKETPETPKALTDALKQLAVETAKAAMEQNQQANAAQNPQKEALQNRVEKLQEDAVPISPENAQALGEAAQQMKQPNPEDQKAAAQKLAEISQNLARQAAALEGKLPEQQSLANMEKQLETTEQQLQKAEQTLDNNSAQAVNDLNAVQQEVKNEQQAAAGPNVPEEAKKSLKEATAALNKATLNAAQTKVDAAKADAKQAGKALADARKAMGKGRTDMADKAGGTLKPSQNTAQQSGNGKESKGVGDAGSSVGSNADIAPVQVAAGLNPKDRDAVSLMQAEKPLRGYEAQVQQFYKNLADGAGY